MPDAAFSVVEQDSKSPGRGVVEVSDERGPLARISVISTLQMHRFKWLVHTADGVFLQMGYYQGEPDLMAAARFAWEATGQMDAESSLVPP